VREITRKANAKINLILDVLNKRTDGYHNLRMIMHTIPLFDTLRFVQTNMPGITLFSSGTSIPTDERNLIVQAANLMIQSFSIPYGVTIYLDKKIPHAAGMAGGSADAAATFLALRDLFSIQITDQKLQELGVTIGADVPYCIMGGTALAEGIGDILSPLPIFEGGYFLIAKPAVEVPTAHVFQNLDLQTIKNRLDIEGMIQAIKEKEYNGICNRLGNVLELVTQKEHPIIYNIKKNMLENGAKGALMSGSGPTVFGMFLTKNEANSAAKQISHMENIEFIQVVKNKMV